MPFSQYAPLNESGADLWLERSNLDGVQLGAVAYGILLTIFIQCIALLWSPRYGKRDWTLLCYTCFMFILGSFGNAGNMRFTELTFIDARNFPGGPNRFMVTQYDYWVGAVTTICFIIASWLQDGLVLYRLWVIWGSGYKILVLPAMMFLGAIVMSCFLMFQLTQPGRNLWTTVNFALPYWCLSIALNIISTGLIVAKLLTVRRRVLTALGSNHARQYISVAAMLIESAALNSVIGLIFIISYARDNNVQNLFLPALGQVQSISPLLITMRVAQGRAWAQDTMRVVTSDSMHLDTGRGSSYPQIITTTTVPMGDIGDVRVGSKRVSILVSESGSYACKETVSGQI